MLCSVSARKLNAFAAKILRHIRFQERLGLRSYRMTDSVVSVEVRKLHYKSKLDHNRECRKCGIGTSRSQLYTRRINCTGETNA